MLERVAYACVCTSVYIYIYHTVHTHTRAHAKACTTRTCLLGEAVYVHARLRKKVIHDVAVGCLNFKQLDVGIVHHASVCGRHLVTSMTLKKPGAFRICCCTTARADSPGVAWSWVQHTFVSRGSLPHECLLGTCAVLGQTGPQISASARASSA